MRLLLVGAFPYPHHQGSQVYFQEQAIALRAAGADVELLTYANGLPPAPDDPDRWRALDGFRHWTTPPWTAASSLRAGPHWGKPLADLGLVMTLHDAFASSMLQETGYDAILTHNAEASAAAIIAGRLSQKPRIPIVYCVHTLLGHELSTYSKWLKKDELLVDPRPFQRILGGLRRHSRGVVDGFGARIDRGIARRVDGWIALTQSASRVMRKFSNQPGAIVPPPIPDPRKRLDPLDPVATAHEQRLPHKGFFLYSGNLDGYQELELLVRANQLRQGEGSTIVLASHDPEVIRVAARQQPGLEARLVESEAEMLALLAAARASIVTRRAIGGFPIKLANSLAVGTAPIAFLENEWGLRDGENARIARGADPARALAEALQSLDRSPDSAEELGIGARALYESNHRPRVAARKTLELVRRTLQ